MKKEKGFTLIELMIVVVIVAILAAVAIPSYQNSIQKTRRAEAKEALTRIAAAQERYFFTNNGYVIADADLSDLNASTTSPDGHYTIGVATGACGDSSCYVLTATAKGSQVKDTACGTFTINHVGTQTAKKSDGTVNTAECW